LTDNDASLKNLTSKDDGDSNIEEAVGTLNRTVKKEERELSAARRKTEFHRHFSTLEVGTIVAQHERDLPVVVLTACC
jgi:hypothetical protein